ncbi:MAG TPA: winged helix DNA-binding domain-containing protein [Micromonosporaceae bacterium]|nr:winged helix DNA-binding domain-containing protein [Micromonosporaceae bacterium]
MPGTPIERRPTDLVTRRMHGHRLWGRPAGSLDEVIRGLGAMQAQEFVPAKWALAQRATGVTVADVDAAFEFGTLLRTHILRPTWHFVHAADLRWMLRASAPRVHRAMAFQYRHTGVDDRTVADSRRVFDQVLGDGHHATRRELATAFAEAGLPTAGPAFWAVLMSAELDAVIVSGAMQGKQQTYALFDARVAPGPTPNDDEALVELSRRYLGMRGPATLKDYCAWASLTVTDARRGFNLIRDDVIVEEIDGLAYWSLAASESTGSNAATVLEPPDSPTVDLVQCYDEVLMGYSESRGILAPTGAATLRPGWSTVLIDGLVAGSWRFTAGTQAIDVEMDLSRDLSAAERPRDLSAAERDSVTAAVDRLGAFFGRPARWLSHHGSNR